MAFACLGGCSGSYILTVPDQVAPAGGEAMAVIRLQRSEIALIALGVDEAAIRFKAADCLERGAYTDKLGYAGTTVPVPGKPGKYVMTVAHMDRQGDEIAAEVPAYVWEPNRAVVAVDMDSLPASWLLGDPAPARQALVRLSQSASIIYLTRRPISAHVAVHRELVKDGYPDGPVLMWQQERWHVVREGEYNVPRVVVESRLVSQIPILCKMFPGLKLGITSSSDAAKGFVDAGMKAIVLGSSQAPAKGITYRQSWADVGDIAR